MDPTRQEIEALLDDYRYLLSTPNIVSIDYRYKMRGGRTTDRRALGVGVIKKKTASELTLPDVLVPPFVTLQMKDERGQLVVRRLETDIVEEGEIKEAHQPLDVAQRRGSAAAPRPEATRPALGGSSVRVTNLGYGTLGVNINYRGAYRLLSNAHVLTQYDPGLIGSMIYSPGIIKPSNMLVPVSGMVTVRYYYDANQPNPVENVFDVAWGDITPALGSPDIMLFPAPPAGIRAPRAGDDASYFGAASGLQVVAIESVTARCRTTGVDRHGTTIYSWWRSGISYILVGHLAGDSGAALVDELDNYVVGLHRAGSGVWGYGCPLV